MAAPYDFFISNTCKSVTEDIVKKLIHEQTLECGNPVSVVSVRSLNKASDIDKLRTRSWCVRVPFNCKETMLKPESWPGGWFYRRFTHFRKSDRNIGVENKDSR